MAMLVYRGPKSGILANAPGFGEIALERDVPREVPDEFAARCVGNNPEPWQLEGGGADVFDVFELIPDKPSGKSKGGDR